MNDKHYTCIETPASSGVVGIDMTDWFSYAKKEPGQPGVFEIDPVPVNDQGETVARYAFFDGRKFGPATNNPQAAYDARFDGKPAYVSRFRGLSQAI